jgi:hypothetical protein
MIRRLFAPRTRRAPIRRPNARLHLEQLEKREVLDAALIQGLNYLTLNAYQTAQQCVQLQATAQADLAHFQQDGAAYTAGKGVSLAQINQDIAALKQDANAIQGADSLFQRDLQFFILGVVFDAGGFSGSDMGSLFVDGYFLRNGLSQVDSALSTANAASSVTVPPAPSPVPSPPAPPPTHPTPPVETPFPGSSDPSLATLTLNPLNVNLLGVNLQTNQIQVNISAQQGNSDLLGNLLGDTSNLLNVPAVSSVLNNVLANAVTLLNSGSLSVAGVNSVSGVLSSLPTGVTAGTTTQVLSLHVAPVTLDLMGAVVTTSPINLKLTAQAGNGLVLGNVVTDLANLFNPPLPKKLSIDDINSKLNNLLNELNQQIPNVGNGATPPVTLGSGQFLDLTVAPIDLNLLGLVLKTSPIQVNATNQTGNGDLLGNITTTLLNTVGATPKNLTTLNNDLNAILGKVVGVLNASTLSIPLSVVGSLTPVLQQLTSPTLVNASGSATAPILDLAIASPNSNSTPVAVDLLGLNITTSNIEAQLLAQTGVGQILGNLLYNVANLLNPGGTASLLPILTELGL